MNESLQVELGTMNSVGLILDQDFTPISDARGSAEFRRVAARNLLLKFWNETARENEEKTSKGLAR